MTEKKSVEIATVDHIESLVYTIRGQQVMLDSDLAQLYGYEVKRLNEQVKRNIERFPEDFMFQLTEEELPPSLRSQNATLNQEGNKRGTHRKYLPFVFTEQGANMLATVLKSEIAIQQSIAIMRAFREMRHYIRQNQQFITKSEMKLLTDSIEAETKEIRSRQDKADAQIAAIHESLNKINDNFALGAELKNFVIYKGQKFEADKAYVDIYQKAKKSIYVVDDYVNIKTLHLLSQKKSGVHVITRLLAKMKEAGLIISKGSGSAVRYYKSAQIP